MRWFGDVAGLGAWWREVRRDGATIALVPTMGYLHAGHGALMEEARRRADRVVVSIFVNPTQFGPSEDIDRYPRDLDRDRALCLARGVDAVFAPSLGEIYPSGFATTVEVAGLTSGLCGASRPGHFRGVTTVVARLFGIVRPDVAVFGEKDFQQLAVIRRMVRDLAIPLEVVGARTVREPDGLALSSRNVYLDADERARAPCIFRSLEAADRAWRDGERDPARLVSLARETLASGAPVDVDYVEVVDAEDLTPLQAPAIRPALLALAVRFGATRLIDNRVLGRP